MKNRNEVGVIWILEKGQRWGQSGRYHLIYLFLTEVETVLGREPGEVSSLT